VQLPSPSAAGLAAKRLLIRAANREEVIVRSAKAYLNRSPNRQLELNWVSELESSSHDLRNVIATYHETDPTSRQEFVAALCSIIDGLIDTTPQEGSAHADPAKTESNLGPPPEVKPLRQRLTEWKEKGNDPAKSTMDEIAEAVGASKGETLSKALHDLGWVTMGGQKGHGRKARKSAAPLNDELGADKTAADAAKQAQDREELRRQIDNIVRQQENPTLKRKWSQLSKPKRDALCDEWLDRVSASGLTEKAAHVYR
jgi:hypothetical protein